MTRCETVIIEDQTLFRELLAKMVEDDAGYQLLGTAADLEGGRRLCNEIEPSLVLLDVQLPDGNGLDFAEELLAELPDIRILTLTSRTDDFTIQKVVESPVAGYVEKDQPIGVLTEAMKAVAEGGVYFSETFARARRRMAASPDSFHKILSRREQQVLQEIARGRSSNEVARKLGLSSRTVGNHRYNLMKKLELKNAQELTAFAISRGFHQL